MVLLKTVFQLALLPTALSSFVSTLSENAQDLFTESMDWYDGYYDPVAGYVYDEGAGVATALHHDVRQSAWYAVGLLARNKGTDLIEAEKIITNVIHGQFKDPSQQWYGAYQVEPEEPTVGTAAYPAVIYNSWDPNWRAFVGSAFIIGLEEFGSLISPSLTTLMLESLHNNTVGDSYRVGGVDGDNLYPCYSNPSIMRAAISGYVGRRLNISNITSAGEVDAQGVIDLFNIADTLSEFNSPTYTGVSLWGLTLWSKYLPEDSVMRQNGPRMITETWKTVSQLYNPTLKNLGGPWDRAYGFDTTRYMGILMLHMWDLVGKESAGIIPQAADMAHSADFGIGPLLAILSPTHDALVPAEVVAALTTFTGEHSLRTSAYSPPWDHAHRNITAWLAQDISIGGEVLNETVIGGPSINPGSFNPAVIQWDCGAGIGFITLYATEPTIHAVAGPGSLNISYPDGDDTSVFQFLISNFRNKVDISSWADLPGLSVNASGSVESNFTVSFAGIDGGADTVINDFEFWNFTYSMANGSTATPWVLLEVELK